MLLESRQFPSYNNLSLRDMFDDEDLEDDIVEITIEDVEHISDFGSLPDSDDKEDLDDEMIEDVIREESDDSVVKFSGHSGSIFCSAVHPNSKLAATGGEDDKAVIWDLENTQIVAEFSNFQDSVTEVGFSFDGLYFAAADMMGNVEVWKIENLESEVSELSVHSVWSEKIEEVQWMEWHKKAHVLLAGDTSANVYMWKIPTGECKVLVGEANSSVGHFLPDGKRAIVAYHVGAVKVFDLSTTEATCYFKSRGWGLRGIISLGVHPEYSLCAAGDTQGKIAIFTTQPPATVLKEFRISEPGATEERNLSCVENLIFTCDSSTPSLIFSTGYSLYIWDYTRDTVRYHIPFNTGTTKVLLTENYTIVTGFTDGDIVLIDARTGSVIKSLGGHSDTILSLSYSRLNNKLMATSDDRTARIFNLPEITV